MGKLEYNGSQLMRYLWAFCFVGLSACVVVADADPLQGFPGAANSVRTFNVKTSRCLGGPNAVGDGVADDTIPIRNCIQAAEHWNDGSTVYLPAGTYAVMRQAWESKWPTWQAIFTISSANLTIKGDGPASTHLVGYMPGKVDPGGSMPGTNCVVTGEHYFKIARFNMFFITAKDAHVTTFDGLDINGQGGFTGDSTVGGITSNCDGWDMTHKGIDLAGQTSGVTIKNSTVRNFRGEVVYSGVHYSLVTLSETTIKGSNASAISVTNLRANNITIGGSDSDGVYNCSEGFSFNGEAQRFSGTNSCSDASANGIVIIGQQSANFQIAGFNFSNIKHDVLLSEGAWNGTISGNNFSSGIILSFLNLYPGKTQGFGNLTIQNNQISDGVLLNPQSQRIQHSLTISGNTIESGATLLDVQVSPAVQDISITNNILQAGSHDENYGASNRGYVGLWAGTVRANYRSGLNFNDYDSATGTATATIFPGTDLVWLNSNRATTELVQINPANLIYYPTNYTVTLVAPSQSNWYIKADAAWNTLGADLNVPIGTTGLCLRFNGSKFEHSC
jgi:Pectate lyase superfamily protein